MAAVMKTSGLAGLLTGAVALGVAELTAAVTGPNGAPVVAVGETAINLTPVPVKEFAIVHFGTHDKQALVTGIVVLLAAFAAGIGVLAARRLAYGLAGLTAFAALGVAAAVSLPNATGSDVVPTLAGAAVAAVTLVLLMRTIQGTTRPETAGLAGQGDTGQRDTGQRDTGQRDTGQRDTRQRDTRQRDTRQRDTGTGRRRFLIAGAGAAALAAAAGGLGDALLGRFSVAPGQVRLPAAAVQAQVPAGADFRIPGLTPFLTSNTSFYRVDTNLVLASKAELTKILTYHVASGRYTSAQLASGTAIKTLEGATVKPGDMSGTYTVNSAHVVCGNVQTANATVYIIDTVLMPPAS